MHPANLRLLLALLMLLLPACASHQDGGGSAVLDPVDSARQEQLADVMLNAGRILLAVEGYDKALLARPGEAVLRVKKGRALLRLNRPAAALAEFRLALAAKPELAAAHQGAGEASQRQGHHVEAREAFQRAVALAPDNWRSRCHLGLAFLEGGQAELAQEQFLAALALPQLQAGAGREELLNNLGLAQVLAGNLEAAVRTFSRALRDARDPERSANNLGLLLVRMERPADALVAFRAAGNDARALNNLGYALYLKGEVLKAQALFEKALDLSAAYYTIAGENLKQAVQAQPAAGAADTGAVGGRGAGATEAVDHGAPVRSKSEGLSAPGAIRLSLSGQSGPLLRFGPAILLGAGSPSAGRFD